MKLFKWILFASILLLKSNVDAIVEDALDVIHMGEEIVEVVEYTWNGFQKYNNASEENYLDIPIVREKQKRVLQNIRLINEQMKETAQKYTESTVSALDSMKNFIMENTQIILRMNEITDIINRISSMYNEMQNLEEHQMELENSTVLAFAEWVVSPNSYDVEQLLNRLHFLLFGNEETRGFNSRQRNSFKELMDLYQRHLRYFLLNDEYGSDHALEDLVCLQSVREEQLSAGMFSQLARHNKEIVVEI